STDLRGAALKDIQAKWKASCFNAILAIRGLQPLARIPPKANDEQEIATLLADLEIVADGGLIAAG
ncbi:MAG: hypothetical protein IH905_00820, partial [Proteobacteria bacterium]|nr:hypothetical protein [Pseudomonadota bacterium]